VAGFLVFILQGGIYFGSSVVFYNI